MQDVYTELTGEWRRGIVIVIVKNCVEVKAFVIVAQICEWPKKSPSRVIASAFVNAPGITMM